MLGLADGLHVVCTSQKSDEILTFNRDVAPIIFQSCSVCHRPGDAGSFPLFTYRDVKSHARQIADVTRSRFMPPWLPAPGDFTFADERRLTPEQIAVIQKWVEQGALEGERAIFQLHPTIHSRMEAGRARPRAQSRKAVFVASQRQ